LKRHFFKIAKDFFNVSYSIITPPRFLATPRGRMTRRSLVGYISGMSAFFITLFERQGGWRQLPVVERSGEAWHGLALSVPAPPGSNLVGALDVEETDDEITVSLDYGHIHMLWPLRSHDDDGNFWRDPFAMIDAILKEEIVSVSGWIGGQLRVGSLREVVNIDKPLLVPKLQHRRVRSWRGTWDRDEILPEGN
jgi:hypothetical protein